MIEFDGRGILLDIEGTTSSVSFVYDVMFPFVRRELEPYLETHWGESDLAAACDQIARDAGHDSLDAWATEASGAADDVEPAAAQRKLVASEVARLMDGDVKATGLKQLQGLIWRDGFESGELLAHVYDDVPPALERWRLAGITMRIYSSGSVQAQKLFFGHTTAGNLLHYFSGHDDTTTGGKKEAASYRRITADYDMPAEELLFLSDVPAELDAAREAGLHTALVVRSPDAAELSRSAANGHPVIRSFDEINVIPTGN
ncbi:MAG: acireductone synthase [Pirellulaceae bacterium]